jgi:hypothetical protein
VLGSSESCRSRSDPGSLRRGRDARLGETIAEDTFGVELDADRRVAPALLA